MMTGHAMSGVLSAVKNCRVWLAVGGVTTIRVSRSYVRNVRGLR